MIRYTAFTLSLLLASTAVQATEVGKAQWIEHMRSALPSAFCESQQYFRQCFDVDTVQCEQTATSATRDCLQQLQGQIPDPLNQPADGATWGNKVGMCAGIAYREALASKQISNAQCNNPANWQ